MDHAERVRDGRDLVLLIRGVDKFDNYTWRTDVLAAAFRKAGYGVKVLTNESGLILSEAAARRIAVVFCLTPIGLDQWRSDSGEHLAKSIPFICHYSNSPFLMAQFISEADEGIIFSTTSDEYMYQLKRFFDRRNVIFSYPYFAFDRVANVDVDDYLAREHLFSFVGGSGLLGTIHPRSEGELLTQFVNAHGPRLGRSLFECYQYALNGDFRSVSEAVDALLGIDTLWESRPGDLARMIRDLDTAVRSEKRERALGVLADFPGIIIGEGWRDILGPDRRATITNASLPFQKVGELIANSQITVNIAHSALYSEHERLFAAWHLGSTLLTERNLYLEREYSENVDYVGLPLGGPECADVMDELTSNREARYAIAEAGWRSVNGRFLPDRAVAYYIRVGQAYFDKNQAMNANSRRAD
jgi:hypothetical protein